MWCSESNWLALDNGSWASGCYYHTVQISSGATVLAAFPIIYFVLIQYYAGLATVSTDRHLLQYCRVLLSILLVILSWTETFYNVADYFKAEDDSQVPIASLLSPVLFSFLPFVTIFIQLEEHKYSRDGSGIVLLMHFIAFCAFLPSMITATHKYSDLSVIHASVQLQRSLKFCLWTVCLLFLSVVAQLLPDSIKNSCGTPDEKYLQEAWEERATLVSRIFFHWFSHLISTSSKETITAQNLPNIPSYLKCQNSFKSYRDQWQLTKEQDVLIKASQSKTNAKKNGKDADKGSAKEKAALIAKEDGASKAEPKKSDLPKEGTICSQKSTLWTLVWVHWRSVVAAGLFKLLHDVMSFANPQILKRFIRWFEVDQPTNQEGVMLSLMLFVVAGTQTLLLHQYFLVINSAGLTVKNALTAMLYEKALTLSSRARAMYTHGEIVNLMAVDAQKIQDIFTYIHMAWSGPFQIGLALYFLWKELGPSILTGIAIMIVLIPINAFVGKKIGAIMRDLMKAKDRRMKVISELLSAIKTVKLYAWEVFFSHWVDEIRAQELHQKWRQAKVGVWMSLSWSVSPFFVTLGAFATYVMSDPEKNILTPEKVFVSITYFNLMRFPMQMFPMMIMQIIESKVSLTRLQNFFNLPEIKSIATSPGRSGSIKIKNGCFKWTKEADANLLDNIDIEIKSGELVAIVGHIGSGKSSLLSAMLNEMETVEGTVQLNGSVGYVPQESWLQNATLQDNVTFGRKFEPAYYQKCVNAAALVSDLEILPSGDQTEIGEKGINLSGGQKQRVSLARAAYAKPDILLFDDPLSAVDPHVAKEIFDNLMSRQSMLRDQTRVLVTHATQFLPRCDRVILLSKGSVIDQGPYEQVYERNPVFHGILKTVTTEETEIVSKEASELSLLKEQISELSLRKRKGQLVEKEEIKEGTVDIAVFKKYVAKFGSRSAVFVLIFQTARYAFWLGENLWLADWSDEAKVIADQNRTTDEPEPMGISTRLGVYTGFGLLQTVFVVGVSLTMAKGGIRAGRQFHAKLIDALTHFPISFFDKTPTGRILNRVGKDMETVDGVLIRNLEFWMHCFFKAVFSWLAIISASPWFLLSIPPVLVVFFKIQRIFVNTTRQLKRIESVAKSPIYAHFGESVHGASTIRAYQYKSRFQQRNFELIDANSQANYYGSIVAYRWLAVRLEFLSHLLVLCATIIFVITKEQTTAGKVGFAVSTAILMSQTLNWFVRQTSDVETHIVAVERLTEYSDARDDFPYESEWESDIKLEPSWPSSGRLAMSKFTLRYRPELPPAVDGITLDIAGGQKIGICGRTGSGKSTLVLSLFRLVESDDDSKFEIDGVDCKSIGLHQLRKQLTIIPQEATLFSATLRRNLDPFDEYSDDEIWRAIEMAHLKTMTDELEHGLDHELAEGGANLSAGQRQLVCLARALLRKTKILILDEATASVDAETDQLVQSTIRKEFSDCTILAVAHRIDTIDDCDKIIVMDKGAIAEFDTPDNLKQRDDSIYHSMYKSAGHAS